MAFQYWRQKADPEPRRTRFLALGGAYHGDTLGDVSVGGRRPVPRDVRAAALPRPAGPSPYCYRCPLGLERADCGIACLAEVERLLAATTPARSRRSWSSRWCRGPPG